MEGSAGWEIPDEDALWDLLERLLATPELEAEVGTLRLNGWKPSLLYFPDEALGHSIRPSVAHAVSLYHENISQGYALLAYGAANRRLLKNEDKEVLDINLLVIDGSTGIAPHTEALVELIKRLAGNISGKQVLFIVVTFLLLYFGADVAKQWIAKHYNEKIATGTSKERIVLSEQETRRMEILAQAMNKNESAETLRRTANNATRALARPSVREDRTKIQGADITREQAETIFSQERHRAVGHRLDGLYRVVRIDTESDTGFVMRVEHIETGQVFLA